MAAHRKYDHIIHRIHDQWCRDNGYPSIKRQALQGTSDKLSNIFSLVKFPVASSERLYQDKCILRMCHVERNLVW